MVRLMTLSLHLFDVSTFHLHRHVVCIEQILEEQHLAPISPVASPPPPIMPMDPPPPPIPPYLKASSRTHSVSSTRSISSTRSRSRPHPQNDYIPTTTATYAIVGTAEPVLETDLEARRLIDGDQLSTEADEGEEDRDDDSSVISEHHDGTRPHDHQDDSDEEVDWDDIRDRDAAIRGKWRRPRPAWLYPFVFVLAMTVGMILAPKSELYVNLACLVHPPRLPSSIAHIASTPVVETSMHMRSMHPHVDTYVWAHDGLTTSAVEVTVNSTVPLDPTISPDKPLTPADRWFLKLQRDIYEYRRTHHRASPSHPHSHSHTSISTSTRAGYSATATLPPGPVPQPTLPVDQRPFPDDHDHESDGDDNDDESEPHDGDDQGDRDGRRKKHDHRFKAIDPAMCKRDPSVQAATAKLIMGEPIPAVCSERPGTNAHSHDCHPRCPLCHDDRLLGQAERPDRTKQDSRVPRGRHVTQVCLFCVNHH